jgi:hypothetical protein
MHLTQQPRVRNLPVNRRGDDFLVSPINGHFALLESRLAERGFRPDVDRVLAVGNVLGPAASWPFLTRWIGDRQIISVLGGQEAALLEWANGRPDDPVVLPSLNAYVAAGHRWVLDASSAALAELILRVREWPLVLRIALPSHEHVGLVVPLGRDWESLHALMERQDAVTSLVHGSRRPLAAVRAAEAHRALPRNASAVAGIDRVVCAARWPVPTFDGNVAFLPAFPDGTPRVVRLRDWLSSSGGAGTSDSIAGSEPRRAR